MIDVPVVFPKNSFNFSPWSRMKLKNSFFFLHRQAPKLLPHSHPLRGETLIQLGGETKLLMQRQSHILYFISAHKTQKYTHMHTQTIETAAQKSLASWQLGRKCLMYNFLRRAHALTPLGSKYICGH